MTRIPTPDTTAATTPDPVLCPGAHLVHRHLADHGHPELLTGGDRAARIQVAFAIRDSAAQLDTDAATLARKLRTLADSVTTLRAGGRLTPPAPPPRSPPSAPRSTSSFTASTSAPTPCAATSTPGPNSPPLTPRRAPTDPRPGTGAAQPRAAPPTRPDRLEEKPCRAAAHRPHPAGQLRADVARLLASIALTALTVTEIAKRLGHSGGAVGNACQSLVTRGEAELASTNPAATKPPPTPSPCPHRPPPRSPPSHR
ncbi:hypothetical protein ACFQZC_08735 [Streptacidiphilus monticola]